MRITPLLVVAVAVITLTGCATNGRRVLLKEYTATVPPRADSPLKGVTISLQPLKEEFSIKAKAPTDAPNEPASFPFVAMTATDEHAWNKETVALTKSAVDRDRREIGNVRNGFGAVLSQVYALNSVSEWLTHVLKLDLEAQGARVVADPQAADAVLAIDGVIRHFKIDMYMAYKADLVVALELKPKGKPAIPLTIYTRAGQTAWSSSSYEYFQSIRLCQQKFSRVLIGEIEKALKN